MKSLWTLFISTTAFFIFLSGHDHSRAAFGFGFGFGCRFGFGIGGFSNGIIIIPRSLSVGPTAAMTTVIGIGNPSTTMALLPHSQITRSLSSSTLLSLSSSSSSNDQIPTNNCTTAASSKRLRRKETGIVRINQQADDDFKPWSLADSFNSTTIKVLLSIQVRSSISL